MRALRVPLVTVVALLALGASAHAATPGVNVVYVNDFGDPYVADPGNSGDYAHDKGDTGRTWRDLEASHARYVRTFVYWSTFTGSTRAGAFVKYQRFVAKARARHLRVILVVTGEASAMATPAAYASVIDGLAARLRGKVAAYEVWNDEDGPDFWAGGPQPAAYTALLRAAYPAVKRHDRRAKVLIGGMIANDVDFLNGVYASGGKGAFDGVGVHLDTACLTAGPRAYYMEPGGRVGRYSFTGYRELHAAMRAHGDGRKPIWLTEIGWPTTSAPCERGARAHTKAGGVSEALQARYLTEAYGCLKRDRYVKVALWFSLHDLDTASARDDERLGLVTDTFRRKPAFAAFRRARRAKSIRCGAHPDHRPPTVRFVRPRSGQRWRGDLRIEVAARDNRRVRKIRVYADGKLFPLGTRRHGRRATAGLVWHRAARLAPGPHTLTALAMDDAGNTATAKVVVTKVR